MANALRRLLVYALPGFLFVIEWVIRSVSGEITYAFIGPGLGTAAMGLQLPLLSPKSPDTLDPRYVAFLRGHGFKLVRDGDDILMAFTTFFFLWTLTAWAYMLFLISSPRVVDSLLMNVPLSDWIGMAFYSISVILCEVKEWV